MRPMLIAALLVTTAATPALSQGAEMDRRIDRVEREIRALQRQVFPGGDSDFFEPEIQSGASNAQAGNPASAPITGLTDRVNALERQLATLTGQVEENSFELRQLRSMVEALQAPGVPVVDPEMPVEGGATSGSEDPATASGEETEVVETPAEPPAQAESGDPSLPDDAGEASYVRGYRLWRDGNYADARTQLQETVETYPGHRFESYARNLLGRAYLDDEKPANATEIFVRNYQELPNGERAADSLFFLGVSLTRLNYNDRACLAFDELEEVYGENLRSTIREQVPAARDGAGCS
jgi:TolA-binding protein